MVAAAAIVEQHPDELVESIEQELNLTDEAIADLGRWLETELMWAESARSELRSVWEHNLRQYEAIPELLRRDTPIINASNIEIPLGAIAADAVYAQIINTIYNIDPLITVREVGEEGRYTEHVKALQRFCNVLSRKINLRPASENAILDDVKMGTGVLYTVWTEKRKRTLGRESVVKRGPMVRAVPIEDFYVPSGSCDDLDGEPWVAIRFRLSQHEMNVRARDFGWDIDLAQEWNQVDRVRQMRERLGRNAQVANRGQTGPDQEQRRMFEVFDVYCYYDIDNDGYDEDLRVTWDRGSRQVLKVEFNPYDRRPFSAMRYQLREHLFYGLGVVEMMTPFQKGATNLYNYWVDNALLANARFWVGRHGSVPNNAMHVWPNRFLGVADPEHDLKALSMADTYSSMPLALQQTVNFAERRSGLPEVGGRQPAGMLGTRTPGITAMSILNKTSERFGPAFDAARSAVTDVMKQSILRYQERILAQDTDVMNDLRLMMGEQRAQLLIELFSDPAFAESVAIELTAATAQVNREADRQAWILLMQQVMSLGQLIMQLAQALDSPQVGPIAKNVAQQLADVAKELLDRVYRSFDQVRDPKALLVDIEAALQAAKQQNQQAGAEQIMGMLEGLLGEGEQQNGGGAEQGVAVSPLDAAFGG